MFLILRSILPYYECFTWCITWEHSHHRCRNLLQIRVLSHLTIFRGNSSPAVVSGDSSSNLVHWDLSIIPTCGPSSEYAIFKMCHLSTVYKDFD